MLPESDDVPDRPVGGLGFLLIIRIGRYKHLLSFVVMEYGSNSISGDATHKDNANPSESPMRSHTHVLQRAGGSADCRSKAPLRTLVEERGFDPLSPLAGEKEGRGRGGC